MRLWIHSLPNRKNARCQRLFVVQQLNLHQKIPILSLLLELIPSSAYFALSGLEMPKRGLFDQETTDGRLVKQSPKLYGMVVMLYTVSIVLTETMNCSGDCHFRLRKQFCFRVRLKLSRLFIIY